MKHNIITKNREVWSTDLEKCPQNTKIDWMSQSGDYVEGGFKSGKLWFLPDGMYVYYTPICWKLIKKENS